MSAPQSSQTVRDDATATHRQAFFKNRSSIAASAVLGN
jgi:hypothetical protein